MNNIYTATILYFNNWIYYALFIEKKRVWNICQHLQSQVRLSCYFCLSLLLRNKQLNNPVILQLLGFEYTTLQVNTAKNESQKAIRHLEHFKFKVTFSKIWKLQMETAIGHNH
jgi:hypothetical protein